METYFAKDVKVRTYPNINDKVGGGKTQLKTRRNIDLHNTPFTYQVTYTESILQPFLYRYYQHQSTCNDFCYVMMYKKKIIII